MSNLLGAIYKGITILDWDRDREGILLGRMNITCNSDTNKKILFEEIIDGLVSEPPVINPDYMTPEHINGFIKYRNTVNKISLNVKHIEGSEIVIFIMGQK